VDANVLFWAGALVDLTIIGGLVAHGIRLARKGQVEKHRRRMLAAAALVGVFLVAYLVKLSLLGREDLSTWSSPHLGLLRFHESCVFVMLAAGAAAGLRVYRIRGTRRVSLRPGDPETPEPALRSHRRAGWLAAGGAALGLISAYGILIGMIERG